MQSALAVEDARTAQGNWSFRASLQDFEFLWPVRQMISRRYLPNLEQLLARQPDLADASQEHDTTLDRLRDACRVAYHEVLTDRRFVLMVNRQEETKGIAEYLAEYVVNGIENVQSHYAGFDVWRREGQQFLALRHGEHLEGPFGTVRSEGGHLREVVGKLLQLVESLQRGLASKHGLPAVPVDDL